MSFWKDKNVLCLGGAGFVSHSLMPLLLDVPQFTGIRIHRGNHDGNTLGCILVGYYTDGVQNWVSNSRPTFAKLMNKLQAAHDDGEAILLEVL